MRLRCWLLVIALLASSGSLTGQEFEVPGTKGMRWYKGNTHTHTDRKSGDSPPEAVALWYKNNGYDFLVISDHDLFTDPKTLSHIADASFLLIGGQEISPKIESKYAHVNALNITSQLPRRIEKTCFDTIQRNVDAIRQTGGVPQICHPNLNPPQLKNTLMNVRDYKLFEIYNGGLSPVNQVPEEAWDTVLSSGKRVYGVACDDAHDFKVFNSSMQNPGRGWVMVLASALDTRRVVESLESGLFYATSGIELQELKIEPKRIEIAMKPQQVFSAGYRTRFIGAKGKVLMQTESNPAVYQLAGGERYVRAIVTDFYAHAAWIQPVFVRE